MGTGEIGAALVSDLLDLGGNADLPQMSPQRRRAMMLEALVQVVTATTKEAPLLLMMEDVHWFDPTTVEFACRLLKDPSESPAMVLMTSRPEGVPEGFRAPGIARIELSPLDPSLAANLVRERAGETVLDAGAVEAIVARGDGVPLFLEEATSAFLETGAETVPASLRDSLTARLDRLGDLRDVAQVAAALGRDVDSDILREVSGDRARAEAGVERLVSMGLAERRPGGFVFSHALVQDAAYHSLLRSKRRALHERISEVLLGRFRRRFQGEPELLAHHLEQAGRESAAIDYYLRAADMATNRAANAEAQQYARRALELCDLLPTGQERDRKEVTALLALGRIKMSLEGYGSEETGNVLRRALDRCRVAGLERTEFPLLVGLAAFSSVAGDGARGLSYAMQARQLAEKLDDPVSWTMCGYVLGIAHCWRGERRDAAAAFESGVSNYDEKLHEQFLGLGAHDPGVVCKARGAFNRFHLNPTAEEYGRLEDGLELARGLAHAHSLNYALAWVARTAIEARDFDLARRAVSETLEIAEAQQFATWRSMGTYGAALIAAQCDPPGTALEAAETALEMLPTGGNLCCLSHVKGLIADALRRLGRLPEAQARFREAIATAERGSMGLGLNETLRGYARCSLDLDADDVDGAEKILRRAVMLARRNGSRVDELRATSDLAEILLEQGDRVAAREAIEPVLRGLQGSMLKTEVERAESLLAAVR